jgi:tryptophan synthase alpha chain
MTLRRTLGLVRELRRADDATPIVLMGYYNPIYRYGPESFAHDAVAAGVDGVIVVDLPPEEDAELTAPAKCCGSLFCPTCGPEQRPPHSLAISYWTEGLVPFNAAPGVWYFRLL